MAPATRSTGVMGMPTVRALDFQSIILVSASEQTTIINLNDDKTIEVKMKRARAGQGLPVNHVDACCADVVALCEGI
jgi:hypothetical protein